MTEPMVAFRSNNNANSNGGVAYVEANYDTSNANDNIGSRLAMIERKRRSRPSDEKDAATARGDVITRSRPQPVEPHYTI